MSEPVARCGDCMMPLGEPQAEYGLCAGCRHRHESERHRRLAEMHAAQAARAYRGAVGDRGALTSPPGAPSPPPQTKRIAEDHGTG
jgi:hypothetical protein